MRGFEGIVEVENWYKKTMVEEVIEGLRRRNIEATYFDDKESAVSYICDSISEGEKVGLGGSASIAELGIIDELERKEVVVYSSFKPNLSKEEQFLMMRKSNECDVFLSGTNAITRDGILVNIDGVGNRVAGMIFGPKKAMIIIGINKIVDSVDEALNRIKNIAAPKNTRRYYKPDRTLPPCATKGRCMNCKPPVKICNITSIIEGKPLGIDMEIVLVGEALGF